MLGHCCGVQSISNDCLFQLSVRFWHPWQVAEHLRSSHKLRSVPILQTCALPFLHLFILSLSFYHRAGKLFNSFLCIHVACLVSCRIRISWECVHALCTCWSLCERQEPSSRPLIRHWICSPESHGRCRAQYAETFHRNWSRTYHWYVNSSTLSCIFLLEYIHIYACRKNLLSPDINIIYGETERARESAKKPTISQNSVDCLHSYSYPLIYWFVSCLFNRYWSGYHQLLCRRHGRRCPQDYRK